MSGPPHHSHGRQAPPGNPAWNHLQVPNFFPSRQPQHAHMSNDHHLLHQPTWHTPTTEPMKSIPHTHVYSSLDQMLERTYRSGGVDLTLTRNGSQNGDLPATPISLGVRDTNKINSLPPGALGIPAVELTKSLSPGLKSLSPGVIKPMSPALSTSPGLDSPKNAKKVKRMDSVIEKLIPQTDRIEAMEKIQDLSEKSVQTPLTVVVQNPANAPDENSNSSGILNAPANDELVSPYSNEDSLDSNKSRRKRKPSKTVRLSKEPERVPEEGSVKILETIQEVIPQDVVDAKSAEKPIEEPAKKTRRKTSSESETIEKIASMVQEVVRERSQLESQKKEEKAAAKEEIKQVTEVKAIEEAKPQEIPPSIVTAAQRKATNFVEVENKLEEMFAGIVEETPKIEEPESSQLEDVSFLSQSDDGKSTKQKAKPVRRKGAKLSLHMGESTPKKKKPSKSVKSPKSAKKGKKSVNGKIDVYAYDSGSNASSVKSRGPFIHIEGNRDSPTSVSIINAATEEDNEKKANKLKKFHDDSEYRHKVRSRGLHCSTLSNKYDAQTKDVSWICVFCKRGPHSTDVNVLGPSIFSTQIFPPGDLFGPYVITNKCPEYERRLEDPYDKQFKSKKIARMLEATTSAKSKKTKRKHSESEKTDLDASDVSLGITATSEKTFEIWTHEDCVVWAPGVYLVGPKIVGLEEAVWTSCNVPCVRCSFKGANVCCLKRGCVNVMHFGCAVVSDWSLDSENFKAFCVEHKPTC